MKPARRRAVAIMVCALLAVAAASLFPHDIPFLPRAASPRWPFHEEPTVRVLIDTVPIGGRVEFTSIIGTPGTRFPSPTRVFLALGADDRVIINGAVVSLPLVLEGSADGIGYGNRRYAGDVLVDRDGARRLALINRVPMERYIEGVVLSEMPANYPEEALKAQAIASRSYAAWKVAACRSQLWDVADNQRSQVYKGNPDLPKLAARITRSTRGVVLSADHRPLEAVFSSTCGGSTRSAEEAFGGAAPSPLRGVLCQACEGTSFASWTCDTDRRIVGKALGVGVVVSISNLVTFRSGRLQSVDILGDVGPKKTVSGPALSAALGPKALSTWIATLDVRGGKVHAEGRGYGHGVGLCQVGAGVLARRGANFESVLSTYYPGATLVELWPIAR